MEPGCSGAVELYGRQGPREALLGALTLAQCLGVSGRQGLGNVGVGG